MSCFFYEMYQKQCNNLEELMNTYQGGNSKAKKLRGALMVKLLKQEVNKYIISNNLPIEVSEINSFIAGSVYEYDLLLVKKNAVPYMDLVYKPEDVLSVIESKAGGLFNVDNNTTSVANAVNRAVELNPKIKFGYITMSENVPVNEFNNQGKPTVKHWELTQKYFLSKIKCKIACYAVTLHKGKKLSDEGSDTEFFEFLKFLINSNNDVN